MTGLSLASAQYVAKMLSQDVRCLGDYYQASAETQYVTLAWFANASTVHCFLHSSMHQLLATVGLDQMAYPIRFQAVWLGYH